MLLAIWIASKGILFLSQWYCIRISHSHRRHILQLRHCQSLQMVAADLSELAKCAVPSGLSHHLCCNKRAFKICVSGGFRCIKGDPPLVAVTLHSHTVQCRVNMRVAGCSTVWVCKRLQLICLSALHLTHFDIYSTNVHSIKKHVSVKRVCLSAMAIYDGKA